MNARSERNSRSCDACSDPSEQMGRATTGPVRPPSGKYGEMPRLTSQKHASNDQKSVQFTTHNFNHTAFNVLRADLHGRQSDDKDRTVRSRHYPWYSRYQSTNFATPSFTDVIGLKPMALSNSRISAKVDGTSPACNGSNSMIAFFESFSSMASI